MTPIDLVLSALPKVRLRQPGQWSAPCVAHADENPSLSVRETSEGAVLLHCFAGCEVADIVSALGLEMADLFSPPERPANAPQRTAKLLTAAHALDLLHEEAQLVGICAGNIARGVVLTEADLARVLQAGGRIAYIRDGAMK